MKKSSLVRLSKLFVFVLLLGSSQSAFSQEDNFFLKKRVILQIKFDSEKKLRAGYPISLNLRLVNNSDSTFFVICRNPSTDFRIKIENEHGFDVPLTDLGKQYQEGDFFLRRELIYIKPNEKSRREETINLNETFKLTRAGNYRIKVERVYYPVDEWNFITKEKTLFGYAKFSLN